MCVLSMEGLVVAVGVLSSIRRHTRSLCDWSSDVCSSDLLADAGVHAVGAHQNVSIYRAGVFELQRHAGFSLLKADALRTEVDRRAFLAVHRALQHAQKIRTIHGQIRVAVALDRDLAEVEELPGLARVPDADLLAFGLAGKRL